MQKLNLGRVQKVLANAITKKKLFLLPTWGLILHNKIREPFCTGDWFIDLNEPTPDSPLQIFRTTFVSENHLVGESFRFSNPSSNLPMKSTISVKILPISQCIKACVFNLQGKLFYYGNYLTSKLLFSKISWQCNDTKKYFSVIFQLAQSTKHSRGGNSCFKRRQGWPKSGKYHYFLKG
jgi:hypothetical protein